MVDTGKLLQSYPFSDAIHPGRKQCCMKQYLLSALEYPLNVPHEVAPLVAAGMVAMHLLNNCLVMCIICTNKAFQQVWGLQQANLHVAECITKVDNSGSWPYICTNCLQTIWFKQEDK